MTRKLLAPVLAALLLLPTVASAQPEGLPPPAHSVNGNPWHDLDARYDGRNTARAFIEISKDSKNKYEVDKKTGKLVLDRVIKYHEGYPANYGFIPKTFAGDGDPLDVLVLGKRTLQPGSVVDVRVVGVMRMLDQGDADDKLIAVEVTDPDFRNVKSIEDLPPEKVRAIEKFFAEYKIAENKVVEIKGTDGPEVARKIIAEAFRDYRKMRLETRNAPKPVVEEKPAVENKGGFFEGVRGFFSNVRKSVSDFFTPKRGIAEIIRGRTAERDRERIGR